MGAWRIFVGFAGTLAIIVLAIGAYYAVSFLVLAVASRVLPLTGRRRKR